MDGLIWFLVFGVLFYLMMRYGCGAHMVHGDHGHDGRPGGPGHHERATELDPVCNMPVRPGTGYSKVHKGVEYHFCSHDCLDKFEVAPYRYIKEPPNHSGGGV